MGSLNSPNKVLESLQEKAKLATSVGTSKMGGDDSKGQSKHKKTELESKISGFEQRLKDTLRKSAK
jgi:hypothetical protein